MDQHARPAGRRATIRPPGGGARPLAVLHPAESSNEFVNSFSHTVESLGFAIERLDWNRIGTSPADLLILHWPTDFFGRQSRRRVLTLIARIALSKLRYGTRFVWIAHNLRPHESDTAAPGMAERLFFRSLDGIIFLSRASARLTEGLYGRMPRVKTLVTVHGRYESARPIVRRDATDRVRLLFFGRIRPYKNIEPLIAAVRASADPRLSIRITGFCQDAAYAASLAQAAGGDPRVLLDLHDEVLDTDAIEAAIDESDGVVLPYKAVLNSGAAFHALSRNRPVLVPALGSLPELAEAVGEWASLYEGEIDEAAIERFAASIDARDPAAEPDLAAYGWDRVARDLGDFMRTLRVRGFARPA